MALVPPIGIVPVVVAEVDRKDGDHKVEHKINDSVIIPPSALNKFQDIMGNIASAPYLNPQQSHLTVYKQGGDFGQWLTTFEVYLGMVATASDQQKIFSIVAHCEDSVKI